MNRPPPDETISDEITSDESDDSPTTDPSPSGPPADYAGPTGLIETNDGYRYLLDDGAPLTNSFATAEGNTYYFGPDGYAVCSEQWVNGELYYFKADFTMHTGWLVRESDGARFYFDPNSNGAAALGWLTVEGKTYYFNNKRKALKGEWKIASKRYFFDSSCAQYTGWLTWKDGRRSYYNPKRGGAAAKGWWTISGKRYYFSPSDNRCVRFAQEINGKHYYFNKQGAMFKGWLRWNSDGMWSYFNDQGVRQFGVKKVYGVSYNFGAKGKISNARYRQNKVLGVPRNVLVKWLESKESNNYYLGTRYDRGLSVKTCLYPNGQPRADGHVGMNCTGFVAHAYKKAGGLVSGIAATESHSPWFNGPGRGSYVNAWRWYGYAVNRGAKMYTFPSVKALLNSGKAQKGDIVFFKTNGARDCHIGYFWGDTPYQNKFWHSDAKRNRISGLINRSNPSEIKQQVVLIKGI